MSTEKPTKFELFDEEGKLVISLDGTNGNAKLGGAGHDGDLFITDKDGKTTAHINGFDGAIRLGGPGQDGDLKLTDTTGNQTIHLNGRSGAIHLGGPDVDGEVFIKNSAGSEVIILDGNAGEIKVNGDKVATADFVFEDNYALPAINDVASFIKSNKHLPNVPSGADIKANGLDLNSFSMQLLRKVEELTLYVIDQNQKLEDQASKIEALENKLNA